MTAPTRQEEPPVLAAADVHPLTLAVVRHKLEAIAEEMVQTMTRTCFSPHLNQSQDFSGVILDGAARTLAQAERVPIHMGAMPEAIRGMAAGIDDVAPGDVLMANDPYWGGSHLLDVTLAKPVFAGERVAFWIALRAHQGDIGGISAGGYSPDAREVVQEGLRLPPVKLVERGVLREDVLRMVAANSRKSEELRGDVLAELAAVDRGAERVEAVLRRYGARQIERCVEAILDAGEAVMRREIGNWRPGTYHGVGSLELGDRDGGQLDLPVSVTIEDDRAVVDFSACPDQVEFYVNSPLANTRAAVLVAFQYLGEDRRTQNDGSLRAIDVITRRGSVLDPVAPAPVAACTVLTASAIIEAVLKAVTDAAPDAVIGGFARRFRFAIAGRDRRGRTFIWHQFFNRGGAGANLRHDGWSNLGVIHNPGGTPSPSIERTEASYPLRIEEYALRPDSGGRGRRRGGLGGVFRMRWIGERPAIFNATGEGCRIAPYGVAGGEPGALNDIRIVREDGEQLVLDGRAHGIALVDGDEIVCHSAGGGGCGDPAQRPVDAIARDRAYGYVTAR